LSPCVGCSRRAADYLFEGCAAVAKRDGVLVADDDPAVRRVLEAALAREGLAVWPAVDGREAVALYRRHEARIGLVILDIRMPGLDGPAALAELRELNPAIRALFVTGHAGEYEPGELLAAGAVAVVDKPFDLGGLVRVVQGLLGT
jgi:CheY-like chemotaxis protein